MKRAKKLILKTVLEIRVVYFDLKTMQEMGPHQQLWEFVKERETYEYQLGDQRRNIPYKETMEYFLTKMFESLPENDRPVIVDPEEIKLPIPPEDALENMYEQIQTMNGEDMNRMFQETFRADLINSEGRRYRKVKDITIMKEKIRDRANQEREEMEKMKKSLEETNDLDSGLDSQEMKEAREKFAELLKDQPDNDKQ